FITTFQKALAGEIAAIQQRFGASAEMQLTHARALDLSHPTTKLYAFATTEPTDRLAVHMVCTLRHPGGETEVTITAVDRDALAVACPQPIDLDRSPYTLVIYPAFLYARLQAALQALLDADPARVPHALRLFGKLDAQNQSRPVQLDHPQLNASQRRAVRLCCKSDLAFIWGPPGTGKTTTLGHIVAELLHAGSRILITSTTNAAIDQVLAQLAELDATRPYLERSDVVRLGQAQGPTFGTSLSEVTAHRYAQLTQRLAWLAERTTHLERLVQSCKLILERLGADARPAQLDLFPQAHPLQAVDFGPVFSPRHTSVLRRCTIEEQMEAVARRKYRLETLLQGYQARIVQGRQELSNQEARVVHEARVALSTTTNLYLSPLLQDVQFDVVIVEEAGMTILPALFFSACLAREKIVIVGDPRQLPAIVQSDDPFVRKYLGMNIFDVTVPELEHSAVVAMLDVQYRMHPRIGQLVSTLYYHGKLHNDETTTRRAMIAARHPYPDAAVVVVDTQGQTSCATRQGQFSRFNTATAKLCVELAIAGIRSGVTSVGIITPYAEQSRVIRALLAGFPAEAPGIECRTVHRFQGSERDMIILDTVDTAPFRPGILLTGTGPGSAARNLVNVAISRARGKLVLIADVPYFRATAPAGAITEMLNRASTLGLH
ncbi:MAG TPA: AAA domain-containing protein, partial [Herpetosiphonaceae bacterium]|nr:AAA domain-containing protein [Herpetosiphonaceae bacterium]